MQKFFLLSAAALGFLGVAIGAFGAHAFRKTLEATGRLETFETAVKYQFYHCFALLAVGILLFQISNRTMVYAGYSFIAGTLVFSGSLYLLCYTQITKWGAVTPFGGLLLLAGWLLLFIAVWQGLK